MSSVAASFFMTDLTAGLLKLLVTELKPNSLSLEVAESSSSTSNPS